MGGMKDNVIHKVVLTTNERLVVGGRIRRPWENRMAELEMEIERIQMLPILKAVEEMLNNTKNMKVGAAIYLGTSGDEKAIEEAKKMFYECRIRV